MNEDKQAQAEHLKDQEKPLKDVAKYMKEKEVLIDNCPDDLVPGNKIKEAKASVRAVRIQCIDALAKIRTARIAVGDPRVSEIDG